MPRGDSAPHLAAGLARRVSELLNIRPRREHYSASRLLRRRRPSGPAPLSPHPIFLDRWNRPAVHFRRITTSDTPGWRVAQPLKDTLRVGRTPGTRTPSRFSPCPPSTPKH